MLSINSSIHEIEEAHKTMSMKQIAKQAGVGEDRLRKILQYVGYEYDNSKRKWRYVLMDETKDCRNLSLWLIMEQMNGNIGNMNVTNSRQQEQQDKQQNGNTGNIQITYEEVEVTKVNQKNGNMSNIEVEQQVIESNASNAELAGFTQDEVKVLKQLAQQHMETGTRGSSSDGSTTILEALQRVPSGNTNKKTFAISESVIAELDAFCDQHRIKKSDFLAVAIQDAIKKYG